MRSSNDRKENHKSQGKNSFKTYYSVAELLLLLSLWKEETKMPNTALWDLWKQLKHFHSSPNYVLFPRHDKKQCASSPALHEHQQTNGPASLGWLAYNRELLGCAGSLFEGAVMDGRNKRTKLCFFSLKNHFYQLSSFYIAGRRWTDSWGRKDINGLTQHRTLHAANQPARQVVPTVQQWHDSYGVPSHSVITFETCSMGRVSHLVL